MRPKPAITALLLFSLSLAASCLQAEEAADDRGPIGEADGIAWADEMAEGSGVTALATGPDGSLYAAGWTTDALVAGAGGRRPEAGTPSYGATGLTARWCGRASSEPPETTTPTTCRWTLSVMFMSQRE